LHHYQEHIAFVLQTYIIILVYYQGTDLSSIDGAIKLSS